MSSYSTSVYTSPSDNSSDTNTDNELNESFIDDIIKCEGCIDFYCGNCELIKKEFIFKLCKCKDADLSTHMELE